VSSPFTSVTGFLITATRHLGEGISLSLQTASVHLTGIKGNRWGFPKAAFVPIADLLPFEFFLLFYLYSYFNLIPIFLSRLKHPLPKPDR